MKEIVALIPVKGQSERVNAKNLRDFAGTSLYELKLNQIKNVKGFADKIVSSESEEVLDIAKKHGFNTHYRDPKYSTSDVPMSDVYSYIASEINGDYIAWVNVTNPLAETDIYEKAIEKFNNLESKFDCLLSVYEVKEYLFFKDKPLNFPPAPWPKSQDLTGTYAMSFIINILKRLDMVKWGSTVGSNPYLFECDYIDSIDVDWQHDFDFCEHLYKQRLENNN